MRRRAFLFFAWVLTSSLGWGQTQPAEDAGPVSSQTLQTQQEQQAQFFPPQRQEEEEEEEGGREGRKEDGRSNPIPQSREGEGDEEGRMEEEESER
ncbi:hypothetical protein NSK_008497 [Nannochloropsis salina CCMP1776]|uniref:RxLR effector protein n=1 Tax=Nannochloropsis salina CCMP1776 TaxID=1027361 RepID=A0A4D9CN27_9STRA|nr:hypothetical protein NSK_008497 [Nannochloropsis salina CCMP1776]|eukprot:TFJ80166.1 hypothetical protein NSK_008497 [Nannochloropsis salina CCMP1776]